MYIWLFQEAPVKKGGQGVAKNMLAVKIGKQSLLVDIHIYSVYICIYLIAKPIP